jgi:hypothetical protein
VVAPGAGGVAGVGAGTIGSGAVDDLPLPGLTGVVP